MCFCLCVIINIINSYETDCLDVISTCLCLFLLIALFKCNLFFQHLARLEDTQSQCQILHTEREALRLQLSEREKMVEILRLQMENSSQMTAQHSCTIDSLQQENVLLSNQLNQHKLDIQQLRVSSETVG